MFDLRRDGNKGSDPGYRYSGGFTLIELLVVISIIALLLSILMPSLAIVKEQAKAVVCSSNMKQNMLSMSLYAYDNEDFVIPNQSYPSYEIAQGHRPIVQPYVAYGLMYYHGYIEEPKIMFCPSEKMNKYNTSFPDSQLGYPYKTIFPPRSKRPKWRITMSYMYRFSASAFSQNDQTVDKYERTGGKVRLSSLSKKGMIGDVAHYASQTQYQRIRHKTLRSGKAWMFAYGDNHVERLKVEPAMMATQGKWWQDEVDNNNR